MAHDLLPFPVTRLTAIVPDGVPILWRGKAFDSGPLTIELCAGNDGAGNQGVLDYARRRAHAEFRVRLGFPRSPRPSETSASTPRSPNQ